MDLLNRSSRGRRRRHERGMAFVETLFVLPILLLLIFAMADFTFLFKDWIAAHHAAKTAVRFASLHRQDCNHATVKGAAEDQAELSLDATGITGTFDVNVDNQETPGNVCGEGLLVATVRVQNEFKYINLLIPLGFDPVETTAVATALNENTQL